MSNKRNRTPLEYISYGLYLYFLGLSLRNVVKALSYLHIVKRSHVQFGNGFRNFVIEGYYIEGYYQQDEIRYQSSKSEIKNPYIPGLFILRESAPILQTLKLITSPFQLLLVDGHGVLHPRRCGLACHIGISTNLPTIGVAKSLLCGNVQSDNFVSHEGEILGYALKSKNNSKKVAYVSVGHKITLPTSIKVVKSVTKTDQYLPEPLIVADKLSKEQDCK